MYDAFCMYFTRPQNKRLFLLLLLFFMMRAGFALDTGFDCHPVIDSTKAQYIVGYGSLISEQSKRTTAANLGENLPVMVTGYQRGWFLKGAGNGFSGTFLGIKPAIKQQMNAVIFLLAKSHQLAGFDKREMGYCRYLVKAGAMKLLSQGGLPKGQYWIYVPQASQMAVVSKKFPIMQSYVDIVLSGCLQIEKKYQLKNYAKQCINMTSDWSPYWVNDRIYPRRPWSYSPDALAIDKLLSEEVGSYFKQITIE